MTATREWSDAAIIAARDLGFLICQCDEPQPIYLTQWRDYECGRCGKVIRDRAT